jgi:hypothetical protein
VFARSGCRLASLIAIGTIAFLGAAAPPALATTTTVTCSSGDPTGTPSLAGALSAIHTGDTVVISGFCSGTFSFPTSAASAGGYTIEGAPGTTSGFDGENTARAQALLGGEIQENSPSAPVMLSNLTFQNAPSASMADPSTLDAELQEGALTLSGDTFTHDASSVNSSPAVSILDFGGPGLCSSQTDSLTIENSTFSDNTFTTTVGDDDGGAGLYIAADCGFDPVTLIANHFTGNVLTATSVPGLGGGLFLQSASSTPEPGTQRGNVFDSNSVVSAGSSRNYGGAGEFVVGFGLASSGDQFTNNKLPGTSGSYWAWGAGLGIFSSDCDSTTPTSSTLADDVVAGNSITDGGSDDPADAQGAGIYIGEACGSQAADNNLALENSTVTDNSVTPSSSAAIAGIDGDTKDNLTLQNSILYGDSGGAETGGFSLSGSSLSATYSDFCTGTAPYTGTGNICANPGLTGGTDVHETVTSPTIDAGSNALVPASLTTDFYGVIRELNGRIVNCTALTGAVDIGAAEYAPVCPATLTLLGATQTNTKWRTGSALATIAKKHKKKKKKHKPPVGTTFAFTLNAQAAVTLTFSERVKGRKVHGICVAPTKKNRHKHSCMRTVPAGALSFTGQPGANTVSFDGAISATQKLKPGSYTVVISATTAGKTSIPATLSFTIAKS